MIGEPLDAAKFDGALEKLAAKAQPGDMFEAAKAIMTTDTYPKVATVGVEIGGVPVTLSGMAKGAGMIAPDMATMLAFVFTDAPIAAPVLQAMLSKSVQALLQRHHRRQRHLDLRHAAAVRHRRGGKARRAGNHRRQRSAASRRSKRRSTSCCSISPIRSCKDGEGARKFVEITVVGAASQRGRQADRAVDRQFAAGQDRDRRRGRQLGPHRHGRRQGRRKGRPRPSGDLVRRHSRRHTRASAIPRYDEAEVSELMKKPKIDIYVEIGLGAGQATVWTCDLTKEYVEINGDYRS